MVALLRRFTLPAPALSPILALALAGGLYGVTALAHGSGFLAVFIAGLVVGDTRTPYTSEIERFHGALAVLAEIAVFVVLGLVVRIDSLTLDVWVDGIALVLALAVLARPPVVLAALAPFDFSREERAFIAWCGLKGAVPILLAAFAVLQGVEEATTVFYIVFVVVLLSVVGQGTPVPWILRRLGIPMRETSAAG
jgi:cell volume regulation protein A